MSTIQSIDPAVLTTLGKRSAFEGVARRQGRRRNPARTTPRSSLRTPTNPPRDHAQRGVEKCGRSITNSETPQYERWLRPRSSCRVPEAERATETVATSVHRRRGRDAATRDALFTNPQRSAATLAPAQMQHLARDPTSALQLARSGTAGMLLAATRTGGQQARRPDSRTGRRDCRCRRKSGRPCDVTAKARCSHAIHDREVAASAQSSSRRFDRVASAGGFRSAYVSIRAGDGRRRCWSGRNGAALIASAMR
jgi:hypothetical protein